MGLNAFFLSIMRKSPAGVLAATGLLTLASVLELVGLAAVIPILSRFFDNAGLLDGVVGDVLTGLGIDRIPLGGLLALMAGMIAGRSALLFGAGALVGRIAISMERRHRRDLMAALLHADWRYHLEQDAGQVANVIGRETRHARVAIVQTGGYYSHLLVAGAFLIVGALVSWQALAVSLAIGVLLIIASTRLNKLTRRGSVALVEANNSLSGTVLDAVNLAKYVKSSAAEDQIGNQFERVSSDVADLNMRQVLYHQIIHNYPDVIIIMVIAVLVYLMYGVFGVVGGDFLFFLLVAHRASSRIAQMQESRRSAIQHIPSYEACEAMIAAATARRERTGTRHFKRLHDRIALRDVSFSFPTSPPVIQGVDIEIERATMVALAGRSGAGKTTLVDVIVGLLEPDKGSVLIDDVPLADYDITTWRERIGFVPQDPILFNGTIAENIRLSCPDASLAQIEAAAKAAHATEFIDPLPDRFETVVGERGIKLSGGQRQRIALARALIREPEVLILDEATSALDSLSERSIHDAIVALHGRVTVIVIAHRLTTVQHADRIFLIKDGKVAEAGTFEELKRRGGDFAALHVIKA